MKRVVLLLALLCLIPYFGFAQREISQSEVSRLEQIYGPAPSSKPLNGPISVQTKGTRGLVDLTAYGMWIPGAGLQNGKYYEMAYDHLGNTISSTELKSYNGYYFCSAEYVNGHVYAYANNFNKGFCTMDLNGNNPVFNKLFSSQGDKVMTELAYNYANSTMYGLKYGEVYKIDMTTGKNTLKVYTQGASQPGFIAMTIDLDGTLYLIGTGADPKLYTVQLTTADATFTAADLTEVATLSGLNAQYTQSMALEYNTNKIYWWYCNNLGQHQLLEMEKTGAYIPVLNSDASMGGLFFEFDYVEHDIDICASHPNVDITIDGGLTKEFPGKTVTVNATVEGCYDAPVVTVTGNGASIPMVGNTFVMPSYDVEVCATTTVKSNNITITQSANSNVTVDKTNPVNCGETVTLTYAMNADGYQIDDITFAPAVNATNGIFTMPNADVAITISEVALPATSIADICADGTIAEPSIAVSPITWKLSADGGANWTTPTWPLSNLAAGNYQLKYEYVSPYGLVTSLTDNFTVNALPTVTVTPATAAICNGSDVMLTAAGSGTGTYLWSTGATDVAITVNPTATTTYTVTFTNANGCVATANVTVTVNELPTVTVTPDLAICLNESATLTADGADTYVWNDGLTDIGTDASITVTPLATTTYTVTGTDANGCVNTATVTVTVNPLPVVTVTADHAICAGVTTTLTAGGADTYVWNDGTNDIGTGATINVTPDATTTYTVTGTDANGCENDAAVIVTVNPLPVIVVDTDPSGITKFCVGETFTLKATAGFSNYQWYKNGSLIVGAPNTDTYTKVAVDGDGGTYKVSADNGFGCNDFSNEYQINVPTLPEVPVIDGDNSICYNTATTLTFVAGVLDINEFNYRWYNESDVLVGTNSPSYTTDPLTVNTYYYMVIQRKSDLCENRSVNFNITVNPTPTVGIDSPVTAICYGGSVILTGTGATSYEWSTGETTTDITVSPTTNTAYTVTGTDANGCTNTATITITVNPLPTVEIAGILTVCNGTPTTLTASGADTYVWGDGTVGATITVTPTTTTDYTVTGTDSNGCENTATVTVNVNDLPTVTVTPDLAICLNESATLTAGGADTYVWNDGLTDIGTDASITVTPLATTTYTVTGTDANGCVNTATVTVTVNPLPAVTVTPDLTICAGETATLTAAGATSYLWSTTETNASIDVTPDVTTTYTVTGTDANGCTNTATVTVTVNTLPVVVITAPTHHVCLNTNIVLSIENPVAGDTYEWFLGATSLGFGETYSITNAQPANAGNYTVVATDGVTGCTNTSDIFLLNVPTPPDVPTLELVADNICYNTSATIYFNAGVLDPTEFTYEWYNTADLTTILGTTSSFTTPALTADQEYLMKIFDANMCENQNTITVHVKPIIVPTIAGSDVTCAGYTTPLTATAGYSAYQWALDGVVIDTATYQTYDASVAGNYTVTVTDAEGCTGVSAAHNLIVNPLPDVVITGNGSTTEATICAGSNITLTASGADSYLWSTGETTADITVNTAGNYYVIGEIAATTCEKRADFDVIVNTPDAVVFTAPAGDITIDMIDGAIALAATPAGGTFSGIGVSGDDFNPVISGVGTFTVTYDAVSNGCPTTGTVDITVTKEYWTDLGNYDLQWFNDGVSVHSYNIETARDLAGFAVMVNGMNGETAHDFTGEHVYLSGNDYDMSDYYWTPIGNYIQFSGEFNGNGNIVKNINLLEPTESNQGLFGMAIDALITNLGVANSNINADVQAGSIAGYLMNTNIKNCFVRENDVTANDFAGGIAGYMGGTSTIENCYNAGTEVDAPTEGAFAANFDNTSIDCVIDYAYQNTIDAPFGWAPNPGSGLTNHSIFVPGLTSNTWTLSTETLGTTNLLEALGLWVDNENNPALNTWVADDLSAPANNFYPVMYDPHVLYYTVSLTLLPDDTYGTVHASPAHNHPGDVVTVTVVPEDYIFAGSVTAEDALLNAIPVTDNLDGTYSFTMPASDVTVTVNFTKDYWTNAGNYELSWYTNNMAASTFEIADAADLAGLAVVVNGLNGVTADDFELKNITIVSDIDLDAHLWNPISGYFKGTLSGRSIIIKNMNVNEAGAAGFFAENSGILNNIAITESEVISGSLVNNVGVIAGVNNGRITNSYATNSIVRAAVPAGIAGDNNAGQHITNCYAYNITTDGTTKVGNAITDIACAGVVASSYCEEGSNFVATWGDTFDASKNLTNDATKQLVAALQDWVYNENVTDYNKWIEDPAINSGYPIHDIESFKPHHILTINYTGAPDPIASQTYTIDEGVAYSYTAPAVTGYTPAPNPVAGTMGTSDVTVDVLYTVNSYDLTVHYVYADGTEAAPDNVTPWDYNTTYTVDSPVITGFTADIATVTGTMPAEDKEVTVTYTVNSYDLTVVYEYLGGATAAPTHTESVEYNATYTVDSPDIEGYTPDVDPVTGTMPASDETITVTYTVNSYDLTVHYVYEDGTEAAPDDVSSWDFNTTYTVASPAITGYTADVDPVTGTMPASDTEVTVTYTVNSYDLTVVYEYVGGATAAPTHTESVEYNAPYTVASPYIEGYTPDVAIVTGTMPASNETITVTYTVNSYDLTVHYVYADGTEAAPDDVSSWDFNTTYTVASPAITGYTADVDPVTGTMPASDTEVTVTYTVNSYDLTVVYEYVGGATAAPTHTETVEYNAPYTVASPDIEGYTPDFDPVTGTMPASNETITVTYTINTWALTINYLYEDGTMAAPQYTGTFDYNDVYNIASPTVMYYTPDTDPVTGNMPDNDLTVDVTYAPDYFNITVDPAIVDGTVTAPAQEQHGKIVTPVITPSVGYALDVLDVFETANPTNHIAVSATNTFVMPTFDVTITATFVVSYWTDATVRDITWYDPALSEYTLIDGADLGGLSALVNGIDGITPVSFAGKTINIANDIDLVEHMWKAIGGQVNYNTFFEGTFNGNKHKVTNMNALELNGACIGFFGIVGPNGVVDQFDIQGETMGRYYTGGIAGRNKGTIKNSTANVHVNTEFEAGGITAYNEGNVYNSYNVGTIECRAAGRADYNVGGVVGNNKGTVENCYNIGELLKTGTNPINYYGGVVGYNQGNVDRCYWLYDAGAGVGIQKGIGRGNIAGSSLPFSEAEGQNPEILLEWLDGWVSAGYFHWAIEAGVNNGYPIFGEMARDGEITNIGNDGNEFNVSLYPNPTKDQVRITSKSIERITVTNVFGQIMFDQAVDTEWYILDMSDYAASTYMVRIQTEFGTAVKSVVKTK